MQNKRKLLVGFAWAVISLVACQLVVSAQTNTPSTGGDFSRFKHDNPQHTRLPCLLCHRRDSNAARPVMPGGNNHLPCIGCHEKQFADKSNAICTVCHLNAQTGTVKEFPRLMSFDMRFNHSRHLSGGAACSTCHKPSRGGVALSIPSGFSAHGTCFQCHKPGAKAGDRDISSCGLCHQPGRYARAPQVAAAFRLGFSHEQHNRDEGLGCNECHRLRSGLLRKQVTAPQALNHHASQNSMSCRSCHNGKKAFGGDDFSACKRCHNRDTWHF
ncbi:MAG TPA: cytochrome c3 family protein [Pyrinomonadaceae bacterium]|nr:cytochrome c3 family protein [Pyrinomonadaceae bacterium]